MIELAVDVGTTNINMAFYDTDKDSVIAYYDMPNRQSLYGRDVINRILTVTRDKKFLSVMKDMVVSDMAEAILSVSKENGFSADDISLICLSGNTTMISILLEYDIESLGISPYEHILDKSVITSAEELFRDKCMVKPDCKIILTGCVSAFIGGDILSGVMYLKSFNFDYKYNSLLIDLGTNGELVLNAKGKLFATSAACGPAFEMSLKRQGVYGSSAIDAVALGVKAGLISKEGSLKEDYLENGAKIGNVHLTSDTIREILLAKAAIVTGIEGLIDRAQISYDEVDNIYIAGCFGNYLNMDNAVYIGLIPKNFKDKVSVIGNSSLKGALMLLNNYKLIDEMDLLSDKIEVLQLVNMENYQDMLLKNMILREV
ncbi:MAG: DUF4445 domain-containing protein [Lachnospiraceae bacterium]|nr:DUF4445 domain-containing protein [Lachnospiraceae bacterium]